MPDKLDDTGPTQGSRADQRGTYLTWLVVSRVTMLFCLRQSLMLPNAKETCTMVRIIATSGNPASERRTTSGSLSDLPNKPGLARHG